MSGVEDFSTTMSSSTPTIPETTTIWDWETIDYFNICFGLLMGLFCFMISIASLLVLIDFAYKLYNSDFMFTIRILSIISSICLFITSTLCSIVVFSSGFQDWDAQWLEILRIILRYFYAYGLVLVLIIATIRIHISLQGSSYQLSKRTIYILYK